MITENYIFFSFAKIIYLIFATLFILTSCDNTVNGTTTETQVEFTNLEQYKVILYSDSSRHSIFAEIAADSTKTIPATPNNSGLAYYPTYYIDVPDIPETTIAYNGQAIITVIEANKTNKVFIPQLENVIINTAYLKIINSSIYSLSLQQGGNEKAPLGGRPSIITPEQNAAYEITPGASSSYSVMRNTTTPIGFPSSFTEFEKGKVYTFTYDGTSLALTATWPIPSPAWPKAPVNVHAELMTTSSVRLSWDTVYGAESYRIYRAWSNFPYNQIATTITPSYTNTNLFSNDLYYYKVSAIKDSKEGEQSNVVSVNTTAPPGNFRVGGSGDTFVLLVWNKVNGASRYNIYRSESMSTLGLKVDTVIPSSLTGYQSVCGINLEPYKTYYYTVSAVIDGAEGLRSATISATTVSPIDFRVSDTTATSISLAWNSINGARYQIHRSNSENGTFTGIADLLTVNNYTDSGLSPNTTYYYYIGITFNIESNSYYTWLLSDRKVSATTEN
jgi:hypothetical protein